MMGHAEAEAALITGVLDLRAELETPAQITALDPEAFLVSGHRTIWAAFQAISAGGGLIDSWTLGKAMRKLGASDSDSQLADRYFADAQHSTGTMDLRPRVAMVTDHYRRRLVSQAMDRLSRGVEGATWAEVEAALAEVSSKVSQAGNPRFQAGTDYAQEFEAFLSGAPILEQDSRDNLIHFGIPGIDDVIMANPGRLIVVGALPSAGKTALVLQAMVRTALAGGRVAATSLEMDKKETAARLVACACAVNSVRAMRYGCKPAYEDRAILDGIRKNIVGLHGCAGDSWSSVEAAIVREHRRAPLKVAIVDYLQLLGEDPNAKGRRSDTEAQAIGETTKGAKRLAQKLGINVVLVSQFNRTVKEAEEPTLQNFLGSGQIERDIDVAILLWNTQTQFDPKADRLLNCRIAKNRGGERYGLVRLRFNPAFNQFHEEAARETSKYQEVA